MDYITGFLTLWPVSRSARNFSQKNARIITGILQAITLGRPLLHFSKQLLVVNQVYIITYHSHASNLSLSNTVYSRASME